MSGALLPLYKVLEARDVLHAPHLSQWSFAPRKRAPHLKLPTCLVPRTVVPLTSKTCALSNSEPTAVIDSATNGVSPTVNGGTESRLELCSMQQQLRDLQIMVQSQYELMQSQQARIRELQEQVQSQASVSSQAGPTWSASPFESQRVAFGDRRLLGLYDARFHSTSWGATPKDFRILPQRIILVRHAESEGNVDNVAYTYIPDSCIPLTERGHEQARLAGQKIKQIMESAGDKYRLFFYISPYKRSLETYEGISAAFPSERIVGVQEEVQLREQDFGNFQDAEGKKREMAERVRFGRFFYRFPNGESGADVYDRITIFEDHMIRDINAGRFPKNSSIVLVTHGLALRIFLMRWFHWNVDQFLSVYNPPNAEPLVLELVPNTEFGQNTAPSWMHTKALYRLTDYSQEILKGCTDDMCSTSHEPRRGVGQLVKKPVRVPKMAGA